MTISCKTRSNDWVANKARFAATWGLPAGILVISGLTSLPLGVIGVIWMLALGWMGIACLRNARACGRMHCYFSGPFFLGSALLAFGIGMQWMQTLSFNGLGLLLLIGTPLVGVLPEVFWGTYKAKSEKGNDNDD